MGKEISEAARQAIANRKLEHLTTRKSHAADCRCVICVRYNCSQKVPCVVCRGAKK